MVEHSPKVLTSEEGATTSSVCKMSTYKIEVCEALCKVTSTVLRPALQR